MQVSELKRRFEELSSKKSELESEKIRLTTKSQVLEEDITKVLDQLQTEFNVHSVEEAEDLIDKLMTEIETDLTEAENKLGEYSD